MATYTRPAPAHAQHRFRRAAALTLGLGLLASTAACSTPAEIRSARSAGAARIGPSKTVVFIHGMYFTPESWQAWESYFQSKGYKTLAPAWPGHDKPVEEQRRAHPDKQLAALTLEQIVDTYRRAIAGLGGEKPIAVGHSMGGLVTQLLLQEGLVAAGIVIDSAPPKGVLSLRYSFLKSNWPAIKPGASLDEPIFLSKSDFAYAFVNCLDAEAQSAAYERFAVPESRRVGQAPTTAFAQIDFARPRAPLLFIAGEEDHIIPISLVRSEYAAHAASPSITDFKAFPGRCHFIVGQPGWEAVAEYALSWIDSNR